jgi:glutathione S-transferase
VTASLVTISFSHFCEKARWALDRGEIPYRESPHAPLVHLLFTVPRGGRSTPLLVRPGARPITDSTDILHFVEASRPGSLLPVDPAERAEVEALEDRFDRELGPHVRRLAYHRLFASGTSIGPMLAETTRGLDRALAPVVGRVAPRAIGRALKIDAQRAARSAEQVEAVLRDVEERVADGRPFLVGKAFSAADLTFAALLSPLVWPAEHPVTGALPSPAALDDLLRATRARPAGRFALALYAAFRRRPERT